MSRTRSRQRRTGASTASAALAALVLLSVGLSALGCRPERGSPGPADTRRAGAVASDARRDARRDARGPARVTGAARAATALHVLRAPVAARVAFEPLAESLVVELFDSRGRPAGGATVLWRVAGGGGTVAPARSTTDSAGRAAASWTPGASADPQTVAIDAPGVGAVELHTTVPAAAIAIEPRAPSLWPGDTLSLRAALADAAGNALAGGAVRWESDDPAVVAVTASGALVGIGAGTTRVTGYVPSGLASAAVGVTVLPVVAGRVVAADGGPAARVPIVVGTSPRGTADTLVADASGRFSRRLPATPDDTVDLVVAAPPGYRPARLRVRDPRELARLGVVLLPTSWTIAAGSYRGERVAVSVGDATSRSSDGTRFWRLERLRPLETWAGVGWPPALLPVAVTFPRRRGSDVSAADSAAFWRHARTLERELGTSLFTPATPSPADSEGGRPLIEVLVDRSISTAGYTFAAWNGSGEIGGAEVRVASPALLADETVVVHELMHALGFGHTSAWPTLMTNAPGRAEHLTAPDVAYAQLLFRVREAARAAGAPYGIVESAAAERSGVRPAAPARRDATALPVRLGRRHR